MKINILLSTIDEGIFNVKDVVLPKRDDVDYIISHQYTKERYKVTPEELIRDDVFVFHIEGKGVTKSRNNAIRHATGDIGLFSDDDVRYKNSYFDNLKKAFEDFPDTDVALFKIKTDDGEPEYKKYPGDIVAFTKTSYAISTLEIAVNLHKIKEAGLYFDERFGAGQEKIIGSEETIFVKDAIDMAMKVVFFPEYIAEHPYVSTINNIPKYDMRLNWVTGAYDCRTNGLVAIPKAIMGTLKFTPDILRNGANPFAYLYHRLSAVLYILMTNKKYR